MAAARQALTETSGKLRLAFLDLQKAGEQVKGLTVDVATVSLSEATMRVSNATKVARKQMAKVLEALEAAEAATVRGTAVVAAAEATQVDAAAKGAEANAAAQAAQAAAQAAETAAAAAKAAEVVAAAKRAEAVAASQAAETAAAATAAPRALTVAVEPILPQDLRRLRRGVDSEGSGQGASLSKAGSHLDTLVAVKADGSDTSDNELESREASLHCDGGSEAEFIPLTTRAEDETASRDRGAEEEAEEDEDGGREADEGGGRNEGREDDVEAELEMRKKNEREVPNEYVQECDEQEKNSRRQSKRKLYGELYGDSEIPRQHSPWASNVWPHFLTKSPTREAPRRRRKVSMLAAKKTAARDGAAAAAPYKGRRMRVLPTVPMVSSESQRLRTSSNTLPISKFKKFPLCGFAGSEASPDSVQGSPPPPRPRPSFVHRQRLQASGMQEKEPFRVGKVHVLDGNRRPLRQRRHSIDEITNAYCKL